MKATSPNHSIKLWLLSKEEALELSALLPWQPDVTCSALPNSSWKKKKKWEKKKKKMGGEGKEKKKPLLMGSFLRKPHHAEFPRGWVTRWSQASCLSPQAQGSPGREEGQENVQSFFCNLTSVSWKWLGVWGCCSEHRGGGRTAHPSPNTFPMGSPL